MSTHKLIGILLFLASCITVTNEDRMLLTSHDVVASIKGNDSSDFRSFIGPKLISFGKDESDVLSDFYDYKLLFDTYEKKGDIKTNITTLYNVMGQRLVDIPIIDTENKMSADSIYHLYLFFGPPNIYTLNKITGYELKQGNTIPEGFNADNVNKGLHR